MPTTNTPTNAAGEEAQQRFDMDSTRRQHERESTLRAINDRYSDGVT